jgi:chorismate dehydratase
LEWTGLPFVFAVWVSNRPLDSVFLAKFNEALQRGLDHIPELTALMPDSLSQPSFSIEKYFKENISYQLTAEKKEALQLFLKLISPKLQIQY